MSSRLAGVALAFALVAILLFSMPSQAWSISSSPFAVYVDSFYHKGDTVYIAGSGAKSEYITIKIYSPDSSLYRSDKIRVNSDGSFIDYVYLDYDTATLGEYKITAKSGKQTVNTSFTVIGSFQLYQEGYDHSKKGDTYVYLDLYGDYQIKDGKVVFDSLYGSISIDGIKSGTFDLDKIKVTLSDDMKKLTVKAKLTDGFANAGNVTAQMRFEDIDFEEGYGGYSDSSKNVLKAQVFKHSYDTDSSYGYIDIYG